MGILKGFRSIITRSMSSKVLHYDYIIIGGGSGGIASSRRAASYGAKTLLIEGKSMGGTCVNVGCVPKKVMWYASEVARKMMHGKEYNLCEDIVLNKENVKFNWGAFKEKRDAYVKRLNGIYERNLEKDKIDFVFGWAKFNKKGLIEVTKRDNTTELYSGNHVLIATGGQSVLPKNIPGYEHGIDSDGYFELVKQPKKVAIVGSGYIATELSGVFNLLGSETHLIIRKEQLLTNFDNCIRETITDHYSKSGIRIHNKSNVVKIDKDETSGQLTVYLQSGEKLESVDELIWAIGRRSLLGLGLENVGVKLNEREQIITDEYQNTNIKNIYSLGDVVGLVELTPVAISTGRKLSDRLFGPEEFRNSKQDFTNIPSVVFSHPEAGSIGLTEQQAIEKYGKDNLDIYISKFTNMYYAMLEEKSPSVYKLICTRPKGKVVGLHIVGDSSAEILQGFGVAIKMGATKADFDSCVAIHPTAAEELVTLK